MKKKYLISLGMLMCAATLSAQSFESEGCQYSVLSTIERTAQFMAPPTTNPTELVMPDSVEYNGVKYAVVSIAANAFAKNTSLATVTLPAPLRDIQNGAFFKTTKLTTIRATGLKAADIEASPFATSTYSKATLYVPEGCWFDYQYNWRRFHMVYENGCGNTVSADGLTYKVLSQKNRQLSLTKQTLAYSGTVTVPDKVTVDGTVYSVVEIGSNTFDANKTVTAVQLPGTLLVINNYAFCNSTVATMNMPASVMMLKEGCCTGIALTEVSMPPRLKRLENLSFAKCPNLTKAVLNDSLTYMGNSALGECPNLKTVEGGRNIVTLMESVFLKDANLTEYVLPEKLVEIKGAAFRESGIKFTTMPKSLKYIELQAFYGCNNLVNVVLPDSLEALGSTAFGLCSNLESIVLPKYVAGGLKSSTGLFQKCSKLTQVTLPENTSLLPTNMFSECTALTEFGIPSYITELGNSVFNKCKNLKKVVMPEGLTTIGSSVFASCTSMETFNLPSTLTTIGATCFSGCTALKAITLPEKVTAIPNALFQNCTALEEVKWGSNVKTFANSVFFGCTALKKMVLPEGVTTLGNFVFRNCTNLDSVGLPHSLQTMGTNVFNTCTSLKEITLRSQLKSIGALAFTKCTALKTINAHPEVPPTVDSTTFDSITLATATLIVPTKAYDAYHSAEVWKEFNTQTTAVKGVQDSDEQEIAVGPGRIIVPEGAMVYNMQGMRVRPEGLPRGVYIVRTRTRIIKVAVN